MRYDSVKIHTAMGIKSLSMHARSGPHRCARLLSPRDALSPAEAHGARVRAAADYEAARRERELTKGEREGVLARGVAREGALAAQRTPGERVGARREGRKRERALGHVDLLPAERPKDVVVCELRVGEWVGGRCVRRGGEKKRDSSCPRTRAHAP